MRRNGLVLIGLSLLFVVLAWTGLKESPAWELQSTLDVVRAMVLPFAAGVLFLRGIHHLRDS